MVKIGYKVLLAADVWTYTPRTLTSHKFPFTNPDSVVDLSNVLMALSGTPVTGRVAVIDRLDYKISDLLVQRLSEGKADVFTNRFIAKEGADITPSVIISQAGDTYDNNKQALVLKKGATTGPFAIQMKDLGALYSKISVILEVSPLVSTGLMLSTDGTFDNGYLLYIESPASAADIILKKRVGGVTTNIATLTEDIGAMQRSRVRFDLDLGANFICASALNVQSGEWRTIHVYDTSFSTVRYFFVWASAAYKVAMFFYPVIILYE